MERLIVLLIERFNHTTSVFNSTDVVNNKQQHERIQIRLYLSSHYQCWYQEVPYEMRLSMRFVLIALFSYVVHGFSSPIILSQQASAIIALSGSPLQFTKIDQFSNMRITAPRGGAVVARGQKMAATSPAPTGSKCPATSAATVAASLWGAGGVIYILAKAIKRVIPIAIEPFQAGSVPLNNFQLG